MTLSTSPQSAKAAFQGIRRRSPQNKSRRRLRFVGTKGRKLSFKHYSNTRDGIDHELTLDAETLEVTCSCEWGRYRMVGARILAGDNLCEHAQDAQDWAKRHTGGTA